jgi:trigger factor
MKVTVEELSPSRRALHVELPSEQVAAKMEATFQEWSRKLQLPGFRRGRVPREIIQRRFQSNVKEEVLRDLIPDSYREAVNQADLHPVSQPTVEDVHFHEGEPLRYRAIVEVKPQVEVKEYRGLALERDKLEVSDEEVERALEVLRDDAAEYVPMEGWPALRDDLVILDHEATLHGKPFKGGTGKNATVILGHRGNIPGLEEEIAGMRKGETKRFSLTFPPDSPRQDLAGRTVEFRVTVKEVKKRRAPELNDEFAKSVGDVDSLAALRDKVRQQLHQRRTREQESNLKRSLLEKLAATHEVEIPESLVESEASAILRDFLETARATGGRIQGLAENVEALQSKARHAARRRVKESLLLEAVARQEGLTVTDAEMEGEIQSIVAAYPAGDGQAVRAALQDPARRAGLRARMVERKALDFLFQNANITEAFHLITPA